LRKTLQACKVIPASAETLFECLADYAQAEVFIEGLEELSPVGSQTTGEGAQFDAVLRVGPRSLRSTIVIESLEPLRAVTWSSTGDNGQKLAFELQPAAGATTVSLIVSYEEPGGLAGALIAPFVERTVQNRATNALDRLSQHVSRH
jgi:ribosome-associated toxin RatA of RatAB toxin-antitoxin module